MSVEACRDHVATIGFCGPFTKGFAKLSRVCVGSLRMVPIAGRVHPLAATPLGDHPPGAAREHVQLVVYDCLPPAENRDFSVSASRTWRLAGSSARHMLLKGGIGWSMMPLAMVTEDLASGELVELHIPDSVPFDYLVDAIAVTLPRVRPRDG